MNIIVVGFGKVGEAIVRQLAAEKHDITVVDIQQSLAANAEQLDVAFCAGNGGRADVLREAGCASADLLIAVTGVDELNILVCSIGKMLGAHDTIARVRNPDYSSQINEIKKHVGIDMAINPEMAATGEMLRILRFPSAMTVDIFAKGAVEIVGHRLKEGSVLDSVPLCDLKKKYPAKVLLCAVERDGEVYIPTGNFVLKSGDRISVVAPRAEIEKFFKATGTFNKRRIKSVMIVGGSRIGFYLSSELVRYGIDVTLIESDAKKCEELTEVLPKQVKLYHGDGSSSDVLDEYDIHGHDAFVALTGMDEENMVLGMYAARQGTFNKVIAKVNRQTFLSMVKNTETETYVSPKLICANQIVQYVRAKHNSLGSNVETLHTLVDGKVEALEFIVKEGSACIGIPLKDLPIRSGMLVACITRKGTVMSPGGNDTIEAGDNVIIVTKKKGLNDLDDILK